MVQLNPEGSTSKTGAYARAPPQSNPTDVNHNGHAVPQQNLSPQKNQQQPKDRNLNVESQSVRAPPSTQQTDQRPLQRDQFRLPRHWYSNMEGQNISTELADDLSRFSGEGGATLPSPNHINHSYSDTYFNSNGPFQHKELPP